MSRIFISYRRDDSADVTGRIYDRLIAHFGRDAVFKDVDAIPFGVNFKEYLEDMVAQCALQLVIIGPRWITITGEDKRRRLDDPTDFVRIEVESALKRDIPVIPLLVMGAMMPTADELPPSLAELAYRNGTPIRRDPDFHRDMDRVIEGIALWLRPKFSLPLFELDNIPAGMVALEKGNNTQTLQYSGEIVEHYRVEPFAIARYPVTYSQFQTFIDDGGYQDDRWWANLAIRETEPAPQVWAEADQPRVNVNWFEAMAFCRWLAHKTGLPITLPTERQWQRAAQGDDGREYPWGSAFDPRKCNTREGGPGKTTPVTAYPAGASPYGLMDMSSNAWEWCLDGPEWMKGWTPIADMYYIRGGSWAGNHTGARVRYRNRTPGNTRSDRGGFRVVCLRAIP